MTGLEGSLKRGELMWWFENDSLEEKAKQLGVSGSMLAPDCGQLFNSRNCQSDSLYYYLSDLSGASIEQPMMSWHEDVVLTSEGVQHESKLLWQNEAGGCDKRYYLQLYLPQKALETKLLLNGVQVRLDDENGLLVDFGGKNKMELELSYNLAETVEPGFVYSYLQPVPVGFANVVTEVRLKSLLGTPYKLISPVATQEDMVLSFRSKPGEETFITVGF